MDEEPIAEETRQSLWVAEYNLTVGFMASPRLLGLSIAWLQLYGAIEMNQSWVIVLSERLLEKILCSAPELY